VRERERELQCQVVWLLPKQAFYSSSDGTISVAELDDMGVVVCAMCMDGNDLPYVYEGINPMK
jgi:hypothetical protein